MQKIDLSKLLLIDVETAPQESAFGLLSKRMQSFWEKKNAFGRYAELPPEETYFNRAGLFAEFGKVVCISAGYFYKRGGVLQLKIKSFTGENESEILKDFSKMLVEHFNSIERFLLCGHNITEFDVPFLSRRLLANSLPIPELLDLSGLKPWQVPHLDTMRFWKFGDYKNYTSLDLIAQVLGIPSPKNDMSGEDVAKVFWEDKDLERIRRYCSNDVLTIGQFIMRFNNKDLLEPTQVEII